MAAHSTGLGCIFWLKGTRKNKPPPSDIAGTDKNFHFQVKGSDNAGVIMAEETLEE